MATSISIPTRTHILAAATRGRAVAGATQRRRRGRTSSMVVAEGSHTHAVVAVAAVAAVAAEVAEVAEVVGDGSTRTTPTKIIYTRTRTRAKSPGRENPR